MYTSANAYFQAFTNTCAPVETLERLYTEAIALTDVVGLAIGTRSDFEAMPFASTTIGGGASDHR